MNRLASYPDFLCLSKGLTGGYLPLSVVMTNDEIYQAFYHDEVARGFLHSHSYTGNPLACRAALATLDIFAQDNVITTNCVKAAQLTQAMQPLRDHPPGASFPSSGHDLGIRRGGTPDQLSAKIFIKRRLAAWAALAPARPHGVLHAAVCSGDGGNSVVGAGHTGVFRCLGYCGGAPAIPEYGCWGSHS